MPTQSLATALWRTLEEGIYKTKSTKRLQELTDPQPSIGPAAEFEDEVLDLTQESWQSDLLDDEDGDDEDELLLCEEYE